MVLTGWRPSTVRQAVSESDHLEILGTAPFRSPALYCLLASNEYVPGHRHYICFASFTEAFGRFADFVLWAGDRFLSASPTTAYLFAPFLVRWPRAEKMKVRKVAETKCILGFVCLHSFSRVIFRNPFQEAHPQIP